MTPYLFFFAITVKQVPYWPIELTVYKRTERLGMFSFESSLQKYVPYKQLRADILSNGVSQCSLTERLNSYLSANRQHTELTTRDFCKHCSMLAFETCITGSHDFLQ